MNGVELASADDAAGAGRRMGSGMRLRRAISYLLIAGGLVGGALTIFLRLSGVDVEGSTGDVLPGVVGMVLAVVLVRRVPENRMSLLMSLIVFTGVTLDLTTPLVAWALEDGRDLLAVVTTHLGSLIWVTFFVSLFVLLPLWFPTGRAIGRKWELVWWVSLGGVLIGFLGSLFSEQTCVETPDNFTCVRWVPTPWGIPGWSEELFNPVFVLSMAMAIPAVVSLVLRFRSARGAERQQLRWLMVASGMLVGTWFTQVLSSEVFGWSVPWFSHVFTVAFTAVLVAIAMAVLRYRLYDIDRIISRTVSYALLVGFLGLVFAAGVVWLPSLLGLGDSPLLVAGSTLLVAGLFNPVRRQVQDWVDRRFNRSRYDSERVMDEFAGSLQDGVETTDLVNGWVGVVTETMQPEAVAVWVRE